MQNSLPKPLVDFFSQSKVPLTLSDPNLPDDPIVLANDAFYNLVGYGAADVIGRNCRFMQGNDTQGPTRKIIRENLDARRDCRVIVRNYRRNGEEFDNFLYLFTILDLNGRPLYRIGSQFEIPPDHKTSAFEHYTAELLKGIEALNAQAASARQQVINLADTLGLTIKDLLLARLNVLRFEG